MQALSTRNVSQGGSPPAPATLPPTPTPPEPLSPLDVDMIFRDNGPNNGRHRELHTWCAPAVKFEKQSEITIQKTDDNDNYLNSFHS